VNTPKDSADADDTAGDPPGEIVSAETDVATPLEAEIIPLVPEESRETVRAIIHRVAMQYSGPIPTAAEMAALARIDSSFPERLMAIYEKQVDHRHTLENTAVANDFSLKRRGQTFALISIAILGALAIVLALLGAFVAAAAVGGTAIVGVVVAFIAGRAIETQGEQSEN
jgi:uncharacterized membrane protein